MSPAEHLTHFLTITMGNLCGVPSTDQTGGTTTSDEAKTTCPSCLHMLREGQR